MDLTFVKKQTDKICIEALKDDFDAGKLVDISVRSRALILLNAYLHYKANDKDILTKIIKKFNDEEFKNIYTKHKLWKYVDFSKLSNLIEYSMLLQ